MKRVRNPQDLTAGLFLVLVAALALIFSASLPVGKLLNMGPGYVPRMLTWILGALGLLVTARGFTTDQPAGAGSLTEWAWRPLLALTAAILVFAFLLEWAGLVICVLVTVAVSGLAAEGIKPLQSLAVGAVLAVMSSVLFVLGLGMPLRLWPEFGG